jgi:hypothetical protein
MADAKTQNVKVLVRVRPSLKDETEPTCISMPDSKKVVLRHRDVSTAFE